MFDLHPKPRNFLRKRSRGGGATTLATLLLALALIADRLRGALLETAEDILVEREEEAGESLTMEFDLTFIDLPLLTCEGYTLQVLDAIGRPYQGHSPASARDGDDDGPRRRPPLRYKAHLIRMTDQSKNRCRVVGEVDVPPFRGQFKISPPPLPISSSLHAARHVVNYLRVKGHSRLSRVPTRSVAVEMPPPSDGVAAQGGGEGLWVYFVNLVPTASDGRRGYQIAASRNFIAADRSASGSLFVHYESSPLRMTFASKFRFAHFLVGVLGILGGLFSCVSLLKESLFSFLLPSGNRLTKRLTEDRPDVMLPTASPPLGTPLPRKANDGASEIDRRRR